MKKRISALGMALAVMLGITAVASGGEKSITISPMTMTVNGVAVTPTKSDGTPAEVFAYNGATYVPLRYLSELLGIQVDWSADNAGLAALVDDRLPTPSAGASGTFTGTAQGFGGAVTATVTVSDGKITACTLAGAGETPAIGGAALSTLEAQVTAVGSAGIDGVSGATITSTAVKTAVQAALDAAAGVQKGTMTPGTYTATAHGSKHDLTVEVAVTADAITGVKVVDSNDSPFISEAAIRKMPQRIVEKQSIAVDAVTGATMTSAGIRSAVSDCLVQAGADLSDWAKTTVRTPGEDVTVDVLVVGGGTSGAPAALAAKTNDKLENVDSGLDVMIVESNGYLGGNMAICGGYIASYFGTALNEFTGHSWDPDELVDSLEELYPQYSNVINDRLMRNLAYQMPITLNSLMDRGFYLTGSDGYIGTSYRQSKDGPTQYTTSLVIADPAVGLRLAADGSTIYGGGAQFAKSMTKIVEESGVDIRYETTATSLIMDGNTCKGVTVQDHEHTYNVYADKIILATGYAGLDDETVDLWLPENFKNIVNAETEADQSFAQKQIVALGGEINNVHDPISDGHIVLGYNTVLATFGSEGYIYSKMPGMMVNWNGERFLDDSARNSATAIKMLDYGGKAYMIFDSTHDGVQYTDFLGENGLAWSADTLEALAGKINVPADKLTATVAKYNSDYDKGGDTVFGTPIEMMAKVEKGPFYAVQVNAISTGGVDIGVFVDENQQVMLTNGGSLVGNLYACGGAGSAGDFMFYNQGLGCHVGGCLTSGHAVGNVVRNALTGK